MPLSKNANPDSPDLEHRDHIRVIAQPKGRLVVGLLLFDGFEALDAFGPLQVFGVAPRLYQVLTLAEHIATGIEYAWHRDSNRDSFASRYELGTAFNSFPKPSRHLF